MAVNFTSLGTTIQPNTNYNGSFQAGVISIMGTVYMSGDIVDMRSAPNSFPLANVANYTTPVNISTNFVLSGVTTVTTNSIYTMYSGTNTVGNFTGNGSGLTNISISINPTNSNNGVLINCSQPYQWFVTNASFAMSGYGNRAVGNYGTPVLTVSNSSASAIYITIPTGTLYPTNSSISTNVVTLPGGSVTVFSFMVTDWQTNCMDGGLWP